MTARVLARGFLLDYARNPTNLLILILVPIVFVAVAADSLADAARLLGGDGAALEQATAEWAAGFLAAVAMYFQVAAARDTDRRLLLSGARPAALVAARLATGVVLAILASTAALIVLALRDPLEDPFRVVAGTVMFALVYLGIGAAVGALAKDPVNGTVVILFIWIVDVFFGPTLSSTQNPITRAFPTHFVSLWLSNSDSGHAGVAGELGISAAWVTASLTGAVWLIAHRSRVRSGGRSVRHSQGASHQYSRALSLGLHELGRNRVLWGLLAVVPAVFIVLADVTTPSGQTGIAVRENGTLDTRIFDPAAIHGGMMAPTAVAALAMLVGLFTILATSSADARLCLAGMRPAVLLAVRLTVIIAATLVATLIALAVAAAVFSPKNWAAYAAGNVLVAVVYALAGVLVGPIFGRVSGVFMAFLLPFLDVGISQSPMLSSQPDAWARWLPAHGGTRLVVDGGLTAGFDESRAVLMAGAWVIGLFLLIAVNWLRVHSRP